MPEAAPLKNRARTIPPKLANRVRRLASPMTSTASMAIIFMRSGFSRALARAVIAAVASGSAVAAWPSSAAVRRCACSMAPSITGSDARMAPVRTVSRMMLMVSVTVNLVTIAGEAESTINGADPYPDAGYWLPGIVRLITARIMSATLFHI